MSTCITGTSLLTALAAIGVSALAAPASALAAKPAQFSGPITDWVVLGPFDNPERSGPVDRGALDVDYLLPIGGEAKARLRPDTTVQAGGATVLAREAKLTGPVLDFTQLYPHPDHKLVYAYTEVSAPASQDALFFLGSDDGARVYVNGKVVFETFPYPGRGYASRQDRFKVKLRKGANAVLVKVENGTGEWKLGMEAFGGQEAADIEAQFQREADIRAFQDQEIGLASGWPGYTFAPEYGGIPKLVWRDADRVRELAGDLPLKVRWFDRGLNEVKEPKAPGRYAAVVESKMKSGVPVRRALMFYCTSPSGVGEADWRVDLPYPGSPIDPAVWKEQSAGTAEAAGGILRDSLWSTQAGASLVAALSEAKPGGGAASVTDSPEVLSDEFQLALKLKMLDRTAKVRPLAPPAVMSGAPAPALHAGTLADAGMKADAKDRIDAVCRKWADDSGEPFTIVVARHGVIVTQEAFGKAPDGTPIPLDYRKDIASITKAITGILFARFVDQGLVTIDDPIGKVLPGFPTKGSQALTFRHLFTHTSGLEGHGNWGGIHNPYLDNVVLNGLGALHPGKNHLYNGMGYDLAGKAMEMMSGKSIVRLFQEDLYRPLGIGDIAMADLAFGARPTAYQLASLGQLMANHGRSGDRQFFSESTFQQLLPTNLGQYYPGLDIEWGIGFTWFREAKPGAPSNSKDPKDLILGPRVIGHGSASSCILRVDLDHDLVIAQVRATAGPKYDTYLPQFLTAIAESMV